MKKIAGKGVERVGEMAAVGGGTLTILSVISAGLHSADSEVVGAFGYSVVEGHDAVQEAFTLASYGLLIAAIGCLILWGGRKLQA